VLDELDSLRGREAAAPTDRRTATCR
jgi:hypothetical protein